MFFFLAGAASDKWCAGRALIKESRSSPLKYHHRIYMAGMICPLPLLLASWLTIVSVRVKPVTRVCEAAHGSRHDSSYARALCSLIPTALSLVTPDTSVSNNTMSSPKDGPRLDASREFYRDVLL